MLKLRVTFINDTKGKMEVEKFKKIIENEYKLLNMSRIYNSRGQTSYSNIYFDVENKEVVNNE